MANIDPWTVAGFGDEWSKFDQTEAPEKELKEVFEQYFEIFPWKCLPPGAKGFDLGCGSGRWAKFVADKVDTLFCIDPSEDALNVAKHNLSDRTNCKFYLASVDDIPLNDNSMDFGYSLGVLHHVPDTLEGIKSCVAKLKPGAPFLLYLYYAFDNRPGWFVLLWKVSDILRRGISRLPFWARYRVSQMIALMVYYPLARISSVLEKIGVKVDNFPLSAYRKMSFYAMRTDALDRFGTRVEHRFTAGEIEKMMLAAGLERIEFSTSVFWCAVGHKSNAGTKRD